MPTTRLKQDFEFHLEQPSNSKHIYTDGSKSEVAVGYGVVHGRNLEHPVRATLPREASIFTAELSAIQHSPVELRLNRDILCNNLHIA